MTRADHLVRRFIEQDLVGVTVMDECGCIVEWNRACERFSGLSRSEVMGRPFVDVQFGLLPAELRTAERRARLEARVCEALRSGFPTSRGVREFRYVPPDGAERWAEETAFSFPTPHGYAFVALSKDITERKQADAARSQLEAQLAHATQIEAMGRLAAGVAHDFNNLLTGIQGYVRLVLERGDLADEARDDLHQVEAAARRATELTAQLLAFGRRRLAAPERLDLGAAVARAQGLMRHVVGATHVVELQAEPELPAVELDVHELERALLNLAANARDAMPTAGRVGLALRRVEVDTAGTPAVAAPAPTVSPGTYVELAFTDTGTGIPAQVRPRIFEPFFTTKPAGHGTGLGLAMVSSFVARARGSISVDSSTPGGTTFRLLFPAAAGPGVVSVPPPSNGAGSIEAPIEPMSLDRLLALVDDSLPR